MVSNALQQIRDSTRFDGQVFFFYESDDDKHVEECPYRVNCDITRPETQEIGQACRAVRDVRTLADYKEAVVAYAKVMKTFTKNKMVGFHPANRLSFYDAKDGSKAASVCS